MLSFSKNNQYRIAVEKWTINIASLWKLTIAEVYCDPKMYNNVMHSDGERTIPFLIFTRTLHCSHRSEKIFYFIWSVHLSWHRLLIMSTGSDLKRWKTLILPRHQGFRAILLFISQDRNLISQCKQPSTSWSKKMSGGYLILRLYWPPRPSEGGDHLLRHSLDSSPLRSTHITDKKNNRQAKKTSW